MDLVYVFLHCFMHGFRVGFELLMYCIGTCMVYVLNLGFVFLHWYMHRVICEVISFAGHVGYVGYVHYRLLFVRRL